MHFLKKSLLFLSVFATVLSAQAAQTTTDTTQTQYPPDSRSQIPPVLKHTYLGFGLGYTDIPYSNADLINGFQATSFSNPNTGINVFIGHFFNPYLAAEISLMRPFYWAYANGAIPSSEAHSIWVSLFGLSLRPTLPITQRFSLYGLAGVGLISRHGFNYNGSTVIPSEDMATPLTGGGATYAVTNNWHLDAGLEYAFAQPSDQQPNILYAFGGFYYLFDTINLPKYYTTNYIFHKNLIEVGGFSTDVFNPNVNKYFTVGYVPIFWTGDVQAKSGGWVMYQRNVFHTQKIFSFDLGTSLSNYYSSVNDTNFQVLSVYPLFRFWLWHSKTADFYFKYEVAGPSFISQRIIDNIDLGGQFTFQDLLGIGAFLGKEKHFNIDATIGHYSNGNLFPYNPGVQVPLVISLGYAF